MSDNKMNGQFKIFVDDNYHYMDKSERYSVGSYDSLEEAVNKCKEITIKSLKDLYEKGITPETLSAQWAMFGEDPPRRSVLNGQCLVKTRTFLEEMEQFLFQQESLFQLSFA